MATTTEAIAKARLQAIERIARDELSLQTLEMRKRDSLDFHELSVWCIREALERAYDAGMKAARQA